MKKVFTLVLMFVAMIGFTACEKEEPFNYDKALVYGTWDATKIDFGDGWIDLTQPWIDWELSLTLYEGGKFCGRGELGNGCGTYTMKGKTIQTYIDGQEYLRYDIERLSNNNTEAEFILYDRSGDSAKLIAKKRF